MVIGTGTVLVVLGLALALVGVPAEPAARASAATSADRLGGDVLGANQGDLGMSSAPGPDGAAAPLPAATSAPAAAPPDLAGAPALRPHEIFGFAPYWTLGLSSGFDLSDLTTIAYFSIDVNPDGSLDESGPGWEGYQSQALVDLIDRAHAGGVRVVLSVTDFDQSSLDQLTHSPTAPGRLAAALVPLLEAKNLDGVNLDLEGEGSGDQAGLTNLAAQVTSALHAANPHYQVTICTYASSAGDPAGFYDVRSLAQVVDGLFVMAYQLNLQSPANPASPLTSSEFANSETFAQYAAAVDPSKLIFGTGFYGEQWTTSDGSLTARAISGPTTPTDAQIMTGGHPVYWDPVTQTAWTSYQTGGVWYEDYYEDPSSLYLIAQMAQHYGFGGVGIWALGMDGNDPAMLSALAGNAPAVKDSLAGPSATGPAVAAPSSLGAPAASGGASTGSTTTTTGVAGSASAAGSAGSGSTTTTTVGGAVTSAPTAAPSTTTTTTALWYSALWDGTRVTLTPVPAGTGAPAGAVSTTGTPSYLGTLGDFQTNDPAMACLEPPAGTPPPPTTTTTAPASAPDGAGSQVLNVWSFSGSSNYEVVAEQPVDCVTVLFTFVPPTSQSAAPQTTTGVATSEATSGTDPASKIPGSSPTSSVPMSDAPASTSTTTTTSTTTSSSTTTTSTTEP